MGLGRVSGVGVGSSAHRALAVASLVGFVLDRVVAVVNISGHLLSKKGRVGEARGLSPILSAQIIITVGRGRKDAETTTVLGGSRLFRGIQSSETLKGGENERFDGRVVRCARVCERANWFEENIIEIVV